MTGSTNAPKKPWINRHTRENDRRNNYKVCSWCKESKRLSQYSYANKWRYKRAGDPNRYAAVCKDCVRAENGALVDPGFKPDRQPLRSARDIAETRRINSDYKRRVRRVVRIKALEYLADKGCEVCGEHDPRVLEFDHIDRATKEVEVGKLLANGHSWGSEKLRDEIRKCRVICANCHRKHTAEQLDYYSHRDVTKALQRIYEHHNITE